MRMPGIAPSCAESMKNPTQFLGLISIVVHDYDESIDFYCNTLVYPARGPGEPDPACTRSRSRAAGPRR